MAEPDCLSIYRAVVDATNQAVGSDGYLVVDIDGNEISKFVEGGIVNIINLGCTSSSSAPTFVRYDGFGIGPSSTVINYGFSFQSSKILENEIAKLDPYKALITKSGTGFDPSIEVYNSYRIEFPDYNIVHVVSNDDTKFYIHSFPYVQTDAVTTVREYTSLTEVMNFISNKGTLYANSNPNI